MPRALVELGLVAAGEPNHPPSLGESRAVWYGNAREARSFQMTHLCGWLWRIFFSILN